MITIPQQLNKCQFIKTNDKKMPIEKDWPRTNNYNYEQITNDKEYKSTTYGVLCGHNNLVVIDCDNKQAQDKLIIKEEFRKTFTVKTATKKLYHFYFYVTNTTEPKTVRYDNARDERIIDLQGTGTQVIGPNSTIDNIGTYEIVNNNEIQTIDYNYLKTIIESIDDNIKYKEQTTNNNAKKGEFVFPEFDEVCKAIKEKITIKDILPKLGITNTEKLTNCPLGHTSEGGKCFSHEEHYFHCFHCNESGSIFHLWMKAKNVKFQEAKIQLAKISGVEQSFKNTIKNYIQDPKTRPQAIEYLAKEFMKTYHVYTIRNDDKPEMYIYKNGIYVPNGQTYVNEYVRSIIENLYQENYANKVIEKIIVDTYIAEEEFNNPVPITLIPFKNKILNLETMETIDYNPKYKFRNKHPVIYDPLIKPELTIKFLKDITNGENDLLTIQEIMGYLYWRENKYEKSIMLLGTGRNGKSKLIDLMKEIIGHENIVNISLTEIENNNFAIANLHNKHCNFSPDISKEVINHAGKFKSLVGRDNISADRKHHTRIHFKNFAKFIFATNNLPYTEDQSDGFFDRWLMLDFPYKFVENPTEKNHKLKDPNILDKISTPKELTGLVNWALEGLKRLFENGEFTLSNTTSDIRNKWLRESSSITGFFAEHAIITNVRDDFVSVEDFNFAYSNYCVNHRLEQDNSRVKNARLRQLGVVFGRRAGGKRGFFGLRLSNINFSLSEEVVGEELIDIKDLLEE